MKIAECDMESCDHGKNICCFFCEQFILGCDSECVKASDPENCADIIWVDENE